jgi:hypothetical protein
MDRPAWRVTLEGSGDDSSLHAEASADRRVFSIAAFNEAWIAERSAEFWITVEDTEGLVFRRCLRCQLIVTPDTPPTIDWKEPASESVATPQGRLAIKAMVQDDIAVRQIQLTYARTASGNEQALTLLDEPPIGGEATRESQVIDFVWDLSSVAGLLPGEALIARLTAEDCLPQKTTSPPRYIKLLGQAELIRLETAKAEAAVAEVESLLPLVQVGREAVESVATAFSQSSDGLSPDERSKLETTLYQFEVSRRLSAQDGAETRLGSGLETLAANRLEEHPLAKRLASMIAQLHRLSEEHFPTVETRLTHAIGALRSATDGGERELAVRDLTDALAAQQQIVDELQSLVAQWQESGEAAALAETLSTLRSEQQSLAKEAEALFRQSLTSAENARANNQSMHLPLAERQRELARRFDHLQAQLDESSQSDLNATREKARQMALGAQMRKAADELQRRQLARAQQTEQTLLKGLNDLQSSFSNVALPKASNTNSSNATQDAPGKSSNSASPRNSAAGPAGSEAAPGSFPSVGRPASASPLAGTQATAAGRLWGHLPDQTQQALQSAANERFLPGYERLIEAYYKRLAHEGPRSP